MKNHWEKEKHKKRNLDWHGNCEPICWVSSPYWNETKDSFEKMDKARDELNQKRYDPNNTWESWMEKNGIVEVREEDRK